MQERTRFQRRLYRHAIRKLKRSADREDRELIQFALSDPAILVMAYEQTMEDLLDQPTRAFGFSVSRARDGAPVVDNLLKLLDWFLQNGPALIEIIQLIASLFGGTKGLSCLFCEKDGKGCLKHRKGGEQCEC